MNSHPFITGIVVGWISLMILEAVAVYLLERHIDKKLDSRGSGDNKSK